MVQCTVNIREEKASCGWQHLACHKDPLRLGSLSQTSLAKSIAEMDLKDFHKCKDELRNVCHQLNTSFCLNSRTSIIEEVASLQEIEEPQHVMSMILLHLFTDVRNFVLTTTSVVKNDDDFICLEQEDCDLLLKELESVNHHLHLETLRIEGVLMEEGVLSEILRRSPRVHSIHVSGDISKEILQCLERHPRSLHSLQLHNTTVNDRGVARALLGSQYEFETLGNMICEGKGREDLERIPHQLLCHLYVESPFVSACGAMVLLHYLPNLRSIRYSPSLFDALSLLQRFSPSSEPRRFSLSSMELWRPSAESISTLRELCPDLRHLMIESTDLSSDALEELPAFRNLRSLTLRQLGEKEVQSVVKTVGQNLQTLKIDYETFTCLPLEVLQTIQETCPSLQKLEMENVQFTMVPGDRLPSVKKALLPELKALSLAKSVVHPAIMERLVVGNHTMESLFLDVNQDALTDHVLSSMLKHNAFERLSSVYLGAGSLSPKAFTSMMALPALEKISLDFEAFPFITKTAFETLQEDLAKGNYRCVLENVAR